MRRNSSAAFIVAIVSCLQSPTADHAIFSLEDVAACSHPANAGAFEERSIELADQCTDRCGIRYRQCSNPKAAGCETSYFLCRQHCASS